MFIQSIGNDRYLIDTFDDLDKQKLAVVKTIPGVEQKLDLHKQIDALVIHRSHIPIIQKEYETIKFLKHPQRKRSGKACLPYTLRPHQEEAVNFILERKGSLLFHDMGLGKTGIALEAAQYPALVLVPNSAIHVWNKEANNAQLKTQIIHGTNSGSKYLFYDTDLFILTYRSAIYWMPYFKKLSSGPTLKTLIADEAHYLQKFNTQATKAFRTVAYESIILSTATPVPNRLRSLWSLLDTACRKAFGYQSEFRQRYCGAIPGAFGGMIDGDPTNTEELADRIKEVSIRRTWGEPQLSRLRPKLHREMIRLDMPVDDRLQMIDASIKSAFSDMKTSGNNAGNLKFINAQRRKLGLYKAKAIIECGLFEDGSIARRNHGARREVIFCWHKAVVRHLAMHLMKNCRYCPVDVLTGDSDLKHRSSVLDEWENGSIQEPRILVATLGVGSESVNLVTADTVYFVEMDWAPIKIVQAEKRHHRPGNLNQWVHAYYITVKGTVDDRISKILLEKVEHHEAAVGRDGQRNQIMTLFSQDDHQEPEDVLEDLARRLIA